MCGSLGMHRFGYGKSCDDWMARGRQRELRKVKGGGFRQVSHCFFNGLALCCCYGLRIERDETAFFGGGEHGSHLHAMAPGRLSASIVARFVCVTPNVGCNDGLDRAANAGAQSARGRPCKGQEARPRAQCAEVHLRTQLFQTCGVDLTRNHAVDVTTALAVVSEVGADMAKFPTVKHFTSWLGLCPGTKISGGKVLSAKTKRVVNRAAQALRLAAAAALRSGKSALGAYSRRLCSRMDKPKAVTAAAHKLARLIYTMLTKGHEYTDQGQDYYEERHRERVLRALSQRAAKLGIRRCRSPPSNNRLEKHNADQSLGRSFLRGFVPLRRNRLASVLSKQVTGNSTKQPNNRCQLLIAISDDQQ